MVMAVVVVGLVLAATVPAPAAGQGQGLGAARIPPMPQPKPAKPNAAVLSVVMPGAGEWLNRDFEGPFPMLECITGYLCFPILFSSVLDAAAGDQSAGVRLNFWTQPVPEGY
jgi:hypothetical protein